MHNLVQLKLRREVYDVLSAIQQDLTAREFTRTRRAPKIPLSAVVAALAEIAGARPASEDADAEARRQMVVEIIKERWATEANSADAAS